MQARLKGLQRIAMVYMAVTRAQELSLDEAAARLREAELRIEQQRSQVRRTRIVGHEALVAGEHEAWKMHESQNQFTDRNTETLLELRRRREALLFEAAEVYRAGRMQLEQMKSVLRGLQSHLQADVNRRAQRESDDRFLARRWWREQTADDLRETLGEAGTRSGETTDQTVRAKAHEG